MKRLVALLSILWVFSLTALALADETSRVYAHKVFRQVGEIGDVHVLVHSDGHLIGNPFSIHIYPDCDQRGLNWRKLDLKIAESACFVDKNAIELNRSTNEIFVKVREMDRQDWQKQLMKSPNTAKPKCLKEHSILKFSVKELCE